MITTDLQRVAAWHLKCADVATAKAAQLAHQRETTNAQTYTLRAEGHRSYAEICALAAKALTVKAKRGEFQPPTFAEVLAFVRESKMPWPEQDVRCWYDHFESNGWLVSGKTRMVDWRAGTRNGFQYWKKNGGQPVAQSAGQADPKGWTEFLEAHPQHEKKPFRYARAYAQAEFAKWVKHSITRAGGNA